MTRTTKLAILRYRLEQRDALQKVIDAYAYGGEVPERLAVELRDLNEEIDALTNVLVKTYHYSAGTRGLWTAASYRADIDQLWECGTINADYLRTITGYCCSYARSEY